MQIERHDRVAVLSMNAGKANAIGPDFLTALRELWHEFVESDASVAVLTGYDRFFSAGLDLVNLSRLDRGAMAGVMDLFHDVMTAILAEPRPVLAAVNGHAIAGGCVLALQADWRVLAGGKIRMGLNETQLGVGLPICVVETLRLRLPASSWIAVALEGRLFDPPQAQALGLVESLAEPDRVLTHALEYADVLAQVPRPAYAQVKLSRIEPSLREMNARRAADSEAWLDTWFSDEAQVRVAAAVEVLTKST